MHPPFQHLGIEDLSELSTPMWFRKDPEIAWGFWGYRFLMYKKAIPHEGYNVMRRLAENSKDGYFIFTSNVDGFFERVFPEGRIVECHGNLNYLQCVHRVCRSEIWKIEELECFVDEKTWKIKGELPRCYRCGYLARPNVLMFGDPEFKSTRVDQQQQELEEYVEYLRKHKAKVTVIEVGAGLAIPTVREFSEEMVYRTKGNLVRINVDDYELPGFDSSKEIAIPLSGKEALIQIEAALKN